MKFRSSFLVLALLAAGSLSMTSCIKNYTCRCVIKYSGYPGLPDSVVNEYKITNDKANAKSTCDAKSKNYNNPPYYTEEKCILY